MAMRLKLLGVRGSRPTHKRALLGYGGNSTSFELTFDKEPFHLFVDGGSGLVRRGHEIVQQKNRAKRFHVLVTHTHWDHILGYPFFKPIYDPKSKVVFHASNTTRSSFHELFHGLQRQGNLPVPVDAIKAKIEFHLIQPAEPFFIEDRVRIDTYQLNHQGVTLGYRVTYGKDSVCIITDNAPITGGNYLGEGMKAKAEGRAEQFEQAFDQGLVDFLKGAHTVVFDTHFTEQNLKADWGHSTPPRALKFCVAAGTSRLILFHHAPEDLDPAVDDKVISVLGAAGKSGIEVEGAREGDLWDLSA